MRHRRKRHLRGGRDRRQNELRALTTALVLYERIETTKARGAITRARAERLVTAGKKPGLATIRRLRRDLSPNAVKKIMEIYAPRYQNRPGGYVRVLRSGRYKDGTPKVMLEFIK